MNGHKQTVIGRAERVKLLNHGDHLIPAKVDTGADLSCIWGSNITQQDGELSFVLFGKGSKYYTGQRIVLPSDSFHLTTVANSFGHTELRYVVKLRIQVLGRTFKATFTLANRENKIYPILIGRRLLKNKFIVDVSRGKPLVAEEKAELRRLHVAYEINED